EQTSGKPTTPRYSPEEKAAAVRMVRTLRAELGTGNRALHERGCSAGLNPPASSSDRAM
ncbi:hypothetical protein GUG60_29440, partial [Xanthomonas citri pv. citri]|nr:hypothetical protein [Xanthomonas citri pv. citri]